MITYYLVQQRDTILLTNNICQLEHIRLLAICISSEMIKEHTLEQFLQMKGNKMILDNGLLFLNGMVRTLYEITDL